MYCTHSHIHLILYYRKFNIVNKYTLILYMNLNTWLRWVVNNSFSFYHSTNEKDNRRTCRKFTQNNNMIKNWLLPCRYLTLRAISGWFNVKPTKWLIQLWLEFGMISISIMIAHKSSLISNDSSMCLCWLTV